MGSNVSSFLSKELDLRHNRQIGSAKYDKMWYEYSDSDGNRMSRENAFKFLKHFANAISVTYDKTIATQIIEKCDDNKSGWITKDQFKNLFSGAISFDDGNTIDMSMSLVEQVFDVKSITAEEVYQYLLRTLNIDVEYAEILKGYNADGSFLFSTNLMVLVALGIPTSVSRTILAGVEAIKHGHHRLEKIEKPPTTTTTITTTNSTTVKTTIPISITTSITTSNIDMGKPSVNYFTPRVSVMNPDPAKFKIGRSRNTNGSTPSTSVLTNMIIYEPQSLPEKPTQIQESLSPRPILSSILSPSTSSMAPQLSTSAPAHNYISEKRPSRDSAEKFDQLGDLVQVQQYPSSAPSVRTRPSMSLSMGTIRRPKTENNQNTSISSPNKSRPSFSDAASWISRESRTTSIPARPSAPKIAENNLHLEEYVLKEGGSYKSWKRRFLVTEEDRLSYYTDQTKKKKKGDIEYRSIVQVCITENGGYYNGKKCVFLIHSVTEDKSRIYFISAVDEFRAQNWVNVMKALKEKWKTAQVEKTEQTAVQSPLQQINSNKNFTQNTSPAKNISQAILPFKNVTQSIVPVKSLSQVNFPAKNQSQNSLPQQILPTRSSKKESSRGYLPKKISIAHTQVEKFVVNLPDDQRQTFLYKEDVTLDSLLQKIIETREAFSFETHQVTDSNGNLVNRQLRLQDLPDHIKEVKFMIIPGMEKVVEEKIRRREGIQLQTPDDVREWIFGKTKDEKLADAFREQGITGDILFNLKSEELINNLGCSMEIATQLQKQIGDVKTKKTLREKFIVRLPSKQMHAFFYKSDMKLSTLLDKILEKRSGFSHDTHMAINNPKDFVEINKELTLEEIGLHEIYFWPRPVDTPQIKLDLTNCLQVYITIPVMNNRCTIKAIALDMKLKDVIAKLNEDLPPQIRSDRFRLFQNNMCLIDLDADFKSLNIGEKATLEFKRLEEYEVTLSDEPTLNLKRYISDTATVGEVLEDLTAKFAFSSESNIKNFTFALRYKDLQLEENKTFMQKKFKEGDTIEAVGYACRTDMKDLSRTLLITYSPWSGRQKQREVYMMKGHLKKKGNYRLWKTRYFMLDETSLRWYEHETKNTKKHQGGLYLHQINSVHQNENEINTPDAFYFTVTVPGREVELQADGEEKGKQWMEAINTLCRLRRAEILYESELDLAMDPTLVHKSRETIEISMPFNPAHRSHINVDLVWTGDEVFTIDDNSVLGQGASGIVLKATVHGGFEVAVKKVLQKDVKVQKEIEKEIDILKKCKHPNIVAYYGTKLTTDQVWIIMDYCGLGSVKDVMRLIKRSLNEGEIQYVLKYTLLGLKYLHEIPVLHLDMKAPNILMTESGDVKLADFGVSKLAQSGENLQATSYVGSPLFMAPEVIKKSAYNHTADIWSLGITVIEMAEFNPPNLDIKTIEQLPLIIERDPPRLERQDDWSPVLHDFLAICLVKDYTLRPNCDDLLEHKYLNPERPINKTLVGNLLTEVLIKKAERGVKKK